jgi:hypothetical protein
MLHEARPKVLPGSRGELDYMIYKTESMAGYLEVLAGCYDATVSLDRAWLGLVDHHWTEFGTRLNECQADLDSADRLAREVAGQLVAYAAVPEEKYLLLRYNRNVIASIEEARQYVGKVIAFHEEQNGFEPKN